MAKKRKSDATRLDEVDRNIYTTFCSAANSLSQLYTQTMNQQKLSFLAGERHALEKLHQWILRQEEQGSRVATADLLAYLQNEIEYAAEEPSMSPRQSLLNLHSQNVQNISHFNAPVLFNPFASVIDGQEIRPLAQPDQQTKNSVFSSVLCSSVQGGNHSSNTISPGHVPGDTISPNSIDCMDIHADGPVHNFPY